MRDARVVVGGATLVTWGEVTVTPRSGCLLNTPQHSEKKQRSRGRKRSGFLKGNGLSEGFFTNGHYLDCMQMICKRLCLPIKTRLLDGTVISLSASGVPCHLAT